MTSPLTITAADAPAAIGPYVQAKVHNGVLYCCGSLPLGARVKIDAIVALV